MSDGFWVFGYGSLMWKPGFEYEQAMPARMAGVHRAPCIYSWVHRGTRERPGIVLGLDRGGTCRGMAFQVRADRWAQTLDYLRARELVTNVYLETQRAGVLETGQRVPMTTYVVDQQHEQYAGRLDHHALLSQIRGAEGSSGPNEEYFLETGKRLRELRIHDATMERLIAELGG